MEITERQWINAEHVNNIRFEKGNGGKVLCSKRGRKLINIKENIYQPEHLYLKLGIYTGNNIVKMIINKK
jgi:hypothetical protein